MSQCFSPCACPSYCLSDSISLTSNNEHIQAAIAFNGVSELEGKRQGGVMGTSASGLGETRQSGVYQ